MTKDRILPFVLSVSDALCSLIVDVCTLFSTAKKDQMTAHRHIKYHAEEHGQALEDIEELVSCIVI